MSELEINSVWSVDDHGCIYGYSEGGDYDTAIHITDIHNKWLEDRKHVFKSWLPRHLMVNGDTYSIDRCIDCGLFKLRKEVIDGI